MFLKFLPISVQTYPYTPFMPQLEAFPTKLRLKENYKRRRVIVVMRFRYQKVQTQVQVHTAVDSERQVDNTDSVSQEVLHSTPMHRWFCNSTHTAHVVTEGHKQD